MKIEKKDFENLKRGFFYKKLKKTGYKFSTWLILLGFIFPAALILYQGYASGFVEKYVVKCPADSMTDCLNPFHSCDPMTTTWCPDEKLKTMVCASNPGFCLMPILKRGEEYGDKKTFLEKHFFFILVGSLVFVYGINHFVYNTKELRRERKKLWEEKP